MSCSKNLIDLEKVPSRKSLCLGPNGHEAYQRSTARQEPVVWDATTHCGEARQAAVLNIARCCGVGSFQQRLMATYFPAGTSVTVLT